MQTYFNINYELDKAAVHEQIAQQVASGRPDYICVADGVVLNTANRIPEYLKIVNGGMFAICDSGYVPLYLKWIYGMKVSQYCGSDIFRDIVGMKKYRMAFLGGSREQHAGLRENLSRTDERIGSMLFMELPYLPIDKFDYKGIAEQLDRDGAEVIWVSLGAPKQEEFMSRLKPHLKRGVMIAVGAVFKFYSGENEKRAPKWMLDHHLEFVYRIFSSPRKQLGRCFWIIRTLPGLLIGEVRRKRSRRENVADFK